jgi:uncharacterized protein (DUF1684 family)
MTAREYLDLLDWKRQVFDVYAGVRRAGDPAEAWRAWRSARDRLFRSHPQSPIPPGERARFSGLCYFDYEPAARVLAGVEPAEPLAYEIGASGGAALRFFRIGVAAFHAFGGSCALDVYWLDAYGGGLFLPFADATSGGETYGAGRYLLDTVKGADLGLDGGRLVLDFNFAYHPSCAYDARWVCPLAPPANRLAVRVPVGERLPPR